MPLFFLLHSFSNFDLELLPQRRTGGGDAIHGAFDVSDPPGVETDVDLGGQLGDGGVQDAAVVEGHVDGQLCGVRGEQGGRIRRPHRSHFQSGGTGGTYDGAILEHISADSFVAGRVDHVEEDDVVVPERPVAPVPTLQCGGERDVAPVLVGLN